MHISGGVNESKACFPPPTILILERHFGKFSLRLLKFKAFNEALKGGGSCASFTGNGGFVSRWR